VTADTATRPLRIGEVAERIGTTPRTIRYYEEIGLLPGGGGREKGKHRLYTETDVERLQQLTRLRDLLGVSLDELKQIVEAQEARDALRRQWHETDSEAERLRIVEEALPHVETQLRLVRGRLAELEKLESELEERRRRLLQRRRELRD
jgi:MerR family transcriptional regulator, repressor of the yfmOP operon